MPTLIVKNTGSASSAASALRARERRWLLAASLVLALGLLLTYRSLTSEYDVVRDGLAEGTLLDLNEPLLTNRETIATLFTRDLPDEQDRLFLAERIMERIAGTQGRALSFLSGGVPNVGYINTIVSARAIEAEGGPAFRERLDASKRSLGLTPALWRQETSEAPPAYPADQPAADGLTVRGQVTGPEGTGLPDALVVLRGAGRADTLRTGTDGRYTFTGLESGETYTVRPLKPYYAFTTRTLAALSSGRTVDFRGRDHFIGLFGDDVRFSEAKPRFVVRTPGGFFKRFLTLSLLFFAAFWIIHLVWVRRHFTGDALLLPLVLLLTGLSLVLMFSLPDALRDRFLAQEVVIGVLIGGALMTVISLVDVQRWGYQIAYGTRKSFIWVGLAGLLSIALLLFGFGPTGSLGAKVNLSLGFATVQPVEVIKACLLLFFAGYFARNWELLRELEQRKGVPGWMQRLSIPRLSFVLPVIIGVLVALGFFIVQKDLGPALVICTTFLLLYGIVRRRWLAAALGFLALIGSFVLTYRFNIVGTVVSRINMLLSPWDNSAGGGEHLAQVFWALTSGGLFGQGIGEGATYAVPAAHTDMIMAAVGEELGLLGFVTVLVLYAVLFHRGLSIALKSGTVLSFFLGVGIVLSSAFQFGLITGGMLGVVPLSGVVSPLLSYGKSALIMHLVFIGVLLGLSARPGSAEEQRTQQQRFARPVMLVGAGLLVMLGLLAVRAGYVQLVKRNDWIVKPALVEQASGRRGFAYNPRILLALDRIRLGTLYDRNGIPLATSDRTALTDTLRTFGVPVETLREGDTERFYPFGPLTFFLLGDFSPQRTAWDDRKGFYAERRYLSLLRGYNNRPDREKGVDYTVELPDPDDLDKTYTVSYFDYRELIPYLKAGLDSRKSKAFFNAPRDYRLSLDIRLQQRVAEAMRAAAQRDPNIRGRTISALVMDASRGEILASLTYPLPEIQDASARSDEEAPQYDHALFGSVAPGSTFKIGTAMAAFRKMGDAAADWTTNVGSGERFARRGGPTGTITMNLAIENSSNVYFARLAEEIGAEAMLEVIEAVGARPGFGTPSRQEALERLNQYTNLPQAGFGQGVLLANPLVVSRLSATVANGGRLVESHFLLAPDSVAVDTSWAVETLITPAHARTLGSYMRDVVIGPRGTGRSLSALSVPVAGKSGTAELDIFRNGANRGRVTHAWFTGYGPYTETTTGGRTLAVTVLVESDEGDLGRANLSGGRDAGPIVGAIFEAAADLGLIEQSAAASGVTPQAPAQAGVVD